MSKNHNKLEYSTRGTLENLKLKSGYIFTLNKDISWAGIKKWDFEEWDIFEITEILLKDENDKSTHTVKFRVKNHKWKTKEYEMSGWIFMKNFSEQLDQDLIVYKKIEKVQEDVKNGVEKITDKEKPKKWHEKLKDKMKWKKKK